MNATTENQSSSFLLAIKNAIPNTITLGNLLCGCLGIGFAFGGKLEWSAYLIGIAAVLDFLDGFVARIINAQSDIGKQLDSLADMVTFGALPGFIMFQLIAISLGDYFTPFGEKSAQNILIESAGLVIVLFSALRLAKFNIDENQTDTFIGMPTPSIAILVASFPLILNSIDFNIYTSLTTGLFNATSDSNYWSALEKGEVKLLQNTNFLVILSLIFAFLLVIPVEMLALKFKGASWEKNKIKYIFLILCGIILIVAAIPYTVYLEWMINLDFLAITLILLLYVFYSFGVFFLKRKEG